MAEYRAVGDEHRDEVREILRHAFSAESGPLREPPEDESWPPELYDQRGLFVDSELASVCKLYYLEATVRGEWTTVGGLGGVATPPEHRRRGYARELLREALREYREAGVDLVTLWPATVPFYRGLGWGTANWSRRATVPPPQLAGIDAPTDGVADSTSDRFRRLDVDDWERLRPVEAARAERFGLSLRRSEAWWRERTIAAWAADTEPYVFGYERDGELAGYVLYHVRTEDGGGPEPTPRRLDVRDLAGVDHAAERALLAFLADHDTQVDTVRLGGPLAADLLELVPDPAEVEVAEHVGPMVRLTDVRRGLAALAWRSDGEGAGSRADPASGGASVVLDVDDPLLERNDGRFVLAAVDGGATVEPAGSEIDPDATVDVGTLSRMAIGSIDVERAERLRGLSVEDDAARRILADAFPSEPVCLREFF